ncbi:MAG: glutamate-cysteine ligase family protein [Flavobacteriales bacterium]
MSRFHLFDVYGVEIEYMIVDRDTLRVSPIADQLIKELTGDFTSDVDRGKMAWSNELVSHVIELKTNGPARSLMGLGSTFHDEVILINQLLEKHNAMLLPTGSHPFFKPDDETVIWPHEYNEVYALYDRIFGCKGHGWANVQSTHINLPFSGDDEFELLHAAVRIILPLVPALCASTPIIEGVKTGFIDTRLEYYRKNQQKIPMIAGQIVPEPAFSQDQYHKQIFDPIVTAIRPYDTEGILDKHFLNSRGAIARFDRGAIEIRLVDTQECPSADIAVLELIVLSLQWLLKRHASDLEILKETCSTSELADILRESIQAGSLYETKNQKYLELFGLAGSANLRDLWSMMLNRVEDHLTDESLRILKLILSQGNLSERILRFTADDPSYEGVLAAYRKLANCLSENKVFVP